MCEYCRENTEFTRLGIKEYPFKFGVGDHCVSSYVELRLKYYDCKEPFLSFVDVLDGEDITCHEIKISHCPFCGRKFN
jgi:hypothetical protein